jgi:hypothetical protein
MILVINRLRNRNHSSPKSLRPSEKLLQRRKKRSLQSQNKLRMDFSSANFAQRLLPNRSHLVATTQKLTLVSAKFMLKRWRSEMQGPANESYSDKHKLCTRQDVKMDRLMISVLTMTNQSI